MWKSGIVVGDRVPMGFRLKQGWKMGKDQIPVGVLYGRSKVGTTVKVISESRSVMSDSCDPHGLYILQARILRWVAFPFSRGSSQFRDRTQSPTLQVDSLPAETQGKPENTGVGSLSLLQRIFPTQESNWGLLCCRRILYQLSYQGS